jgi:hypothetical protein
MDTDAFKPQVAIAKHCAVLFRLFKKQRGRRAKCAKSIGFCGIAAAGTRVASRNEKLNSLADQKYRFAVVGRRLAWRHHAAPRAIPAQEN